MCTCNEYINHHINYHHRLIPVESSQLTVFITGAHLSEIRLKIFQYYIII